MDSQYTLPVSAMVEVMLPSSEIVMLQAPLSSLPGVLREECLATIIIGQKQVYSCMLTTKKAGTVILQQQDAYAALERCGDLNWSVVPASPSMPSKVSRQFVSPQPGISSYSLPKIPVLRVQLTPGILDAISSPYRRVIALIDGKRSVEEIARLLNKQPQEVQQMLTALQHLIEF